MMVVVQEVVFWVPGKGGSLRIKRIADDIIRTVRLSHTQLPDRPKPGDVWICETFPESPGKPGEKPPAVTALPPLSAPSQDTSEQPTLTKGWDAFLHLRFSKTKVAWRTEAINRWTHTNNQNTPPSPARPPTPSSPNLNTTTTRDLDTEVFFQNALAEMNEWDMLVRCWHHLHQNGLPAHISATLAAVWREDVVRRITENPYRLLTVLPWPTVDAFARKQGFAANAPFRLTAAVDAAMEKLLLDGQDTPSTREVVAQANVLSGQDTANTLRGMISEGKLIAIDTTTPLAQEDSVRLPGVHALWQQVMAVATGRGKTDSDSGANRHSRTHTEQGHLPFLSVFCQGEGEGDVQDNKKGKVTQRLDSATFEHLTQEQKQAIEMAITHPFSLILGGAGTGKTTALKGLHTLAEAEEIPVLQCAISARAARRMEEATGRPAATIAKILTLVKHHQDVVPEHALVVVDEASMVDLATISRLIRSLPETARWCLVGDTGQLPPITFGVVLDALVATHDVPRTTLTHIHRQAQRTGIPQYAQAVREGLSPPLKPYQGEVEGVFSIETDDTLLMASLIKLRDQHPDMMILSPVKKGARGVHAINRAFHRHHMQKLLSKECVSDDHTSEHQRSEQAHTRETKESTFLPGEPVVFTVNRPDLGLLNGSLGLVLSTTDQTVTVDFDGTHTTLNREQALLLDHAYALTVHKAQGSQWRVVAFVTPTNNRADKRMTYTAITRAQHLLLKTQRKEPNKL